MGRLSADEREQVRSSLYAAFEEVGKAAAVAKQKDAAGLLKKLANIGEKLKTLYEKYRD